MGILDEKMARELLSTTTTEPHLLNHALAVSSAMGAMARYFGEDEEYWKSVGFLHDFDYQQYPQEHLQHTEQPLREAGVDEESIRAIMAHGYGLVSDVKPETNLEKSLYAVDEMTGLISATALMRPSGISDLTPKSVNKKFKDKAFAAKIDRDVIRNGSEMLGMELNELIRICIEGMSGEMDALGIGPKEE